MLSRTAVRAARPIRAAIRPTTSSTRPFSVQHARRAVDEGVVDDPEQNGNYVNPPAIKRSLRDPYGDYFDKQERRHWNEPVHEDDDILRVFSTEEYRHFTPGWGAVLFSTFVGTVFALCAVCYVTYPDKPAVPRTFDEGLEKEFGGPAALRARKEGEDTWITLSEETD